MGPRPVSVMVSYEHIYGRNCSTLSRSISSNKVFPNAMKANSYHRVASLLGLLWIADRLMSVVMLRFCCVRS
ncbi:hypothetical protein U1Q18_009015 [Sarracenia purpurea var. burkii]